MLSQLNYHPPVFYRSLTDIEQGGIENPYSHFMCRAWEVMGLDGIYCIDKKPTIYFKQLTVIEPNVALELHKKFWNQGVATLLVLISTHEIQVYSSLVLPVNPNRENDDNLTPLVERLETLGASIEIYDIIRRVETGIFYHTYPDKFANKNAIDRHLLQNLAGLRKKILGENDKDLHRIKCVHQLLGRIIFTCYLIDRAIIDAKYFDSLGIKQVNNLKDLFNQYSAKQAKAHLYTLFEALQEYFNGSMYDEGVDTEQSLLNEQSIVYLGDFFNGLEFDSNQFTLFWLYDFSVIPIETISAIYEDFLKKEGSEAKNSAGAYYTPKHLAEMVIDVATEQWQGNLLAKRVLDPACGSGIFLVILFNRLATEWRYKNPHANNIARAEALNAILKTQLYGIDINETACRITCFSLYVALLDQLEPRDIQALKQKYGYVLVKLLALQENNYQDYPAATVYEGNFFDPALPVQQDFDLVIGNPPWVGRGQPEDVIAKNWYGSAHNPFLAHFTDKKQWDACFRPQKQIAHLFMWKAPLHTKPEGQICLLLPSKVFLNKNTNTFQKTWLTQITLEKVIQLADMRFILFENALCPSAITKFLPKATDSDYIFAYEIPKASRHDPRLGIVTALPEDCHYVKVSELLSAADKEETPVVWKQYFWGCSRSNELLEWLLAYPRLEKLAGGENEGKRWIKGQGFQAFKQEYYERDTPNYKEPQPIWWTSEQLFLDASKKSTPLVLCPTDFNTIGKSKKAQKIMFLHRSRNKLLFIPPMVLFNQGFSWKAFCHFPILFQDSIQSIKGQPTDAKLLMFLATVLNSKLADYFYFHTAANWGAERDKVHFFEIMRLPFPLPEDMDDPARATEIINEVAEQLVALQHDIENITFNREQEIAEVRAKLEPLVYEYYEISEREQIFIEDTVQLFEPSSTPTSLSVNVNIPTLRTVKTTQERRTYVSLVCEVLNNLAKYSNFKVSGSVIVSNRLGLSIIVLTKHTAELEYTESNSEQELDTVLAQILNKIPEQHSQLVYLKNIKIFDANKLYIIKPDIQRYWSRTMALSDAAEITSSILLSSQGIDNNGYES